ncbi:MAG: hypothetical protein H7039_11965 [Bryobacteraceae bacterium]|nr:hypothetical protein [Bryobacteraceae bacterium]
MTKITRRALGGVLVGGLAVAAAFSAAVFPLSPEQRLRQLVRRRLNYLTVPDPVLDAFVQDYAADPGNEMRYFGSRRYIAQRAAYSVPAVSAHLPMFRFERHIVSQFLQSTDFFRNGADVSRPLLYVAYCDPYKQGCANYLAKVG